jgi:DNA-binding transcriptional MerR regulator
VSYLISVSSPTRYAIGDLARLAGVSRRTVRYYVQEGLIPAPLGVGRGNHYGPEHLEQILRVKAMQEAGQTLEEIRRPTSVGAAARRKIRREPEPVLLERSLWRRMTLAPGVELQIAANIRLPPPGRLQELAAWCRLHLAPPTREEDEAADV